MISGKTKIRIVRMARKILKPQTTSGRDHVQLTTRDSVMIRSKTDPGSRRVGVYLRGGCDVPALFAMDTELRDNVEGTCVIYRDSIAVSGSRSDLLLQALDGLEDVPQAALDNVSKMLDLPSRYFKADIFEPTFEVRGGKGDSRTFSKDVMVLSAAPDYSRSLYRHREHGFLVDPGGYWLSNSIDSAMADMGAVEAFNKDFKKIGRMTTELFHESFGRLVREMQERTKAHILVMNVLTVDPSDPTHNYRLAKNHDTARRKEFTIALAELSRELGFDVLDVDRTLKVGGVQGQVDFAHFTDEQFEPIGREAYRILREREIL